MADDQQKTSAPSELDALRLRLERSESLLDNVLDGIITIDEAGTVQTFNRPAEVIFGYRSEEVIGRNVAMLMPEPWRSEHNDYISRYVHTGKPRIIGIGREVTGLRKDGTTFPMDLAISEFVHAGKRVFTGICRNIAERKRLEEQLIQSSKLASLGELVGGISHEINNPAGIILMRASSLMHEAQALEWPEDAVHDIRVIQRQTEKLAQITSGLLAFSRRSPFRAVPGDLNRTVNSALALVENVMKNRGITCTRDLAETLPEVTYDATRIEQVLLNLFNNAMDAMPSGGELRVDTDVGEDGDAGTVRIGVHDSGEGIAPENLERLFDPFFTTKEVGKGTGLGLAISYGIVQEHGGRLEVKSTLGQGASFLVRLPKDGADSATKPDGDR